jgi:hypothetical protein
MKIKDLVFFIQQSSVVVLERASNNRVKKKDSLDLLVHYQIAAWEQKKEIRHEWNGEDLLRLLASWKSHPNLFFRWFPLLCAFLLLHREFCSEKTVEREILCLETCCNLLFQHHKVLCFGDL